MFTYDHYAHTDSPDSANRSRRQVTADARQHTLALDTDRDRVALYAAYLAGGCPAGVLTDADALTETAHARQDAETAVTDADPPLHMEFHPLRTPNGAAAVWCLRQMLVRSGATAKEAQVLVRHSEGWNQRFLPVRGNPRGQHGTS